MLLTISTKHNKSLFRKLKSNFLNTQINKSILFGKHNPNEKQNIHKAMVRP